MKKLLFALPIILLMAAGCSSSDTSQLTSQAQPTPPQQVVQNPSPKPSSTPAQIAPPIAKIQGKTYTDSLIQGDSGIIEGSLSYPSEGIPDNMLVCAENQSSHDQYCTSKKITGSKYLYKVGYKIQVPVGQYTVYSALPGQPNYKAYYDEAVTCGLNAHCTSTKPIVVDVMTNQSLQEVDPIDWYNMNQ